jgi:hypothetical protein
MSTEYLKWAHKIWARKFVSLVEFTARNKHQPSRQNVVEVDYFDEWLNLASFIQFSLSHCPNNFAGVSINASH